jgi:hypothetical protein
MEYYIVIRVNGEEVQRYGLDEEYTATWVWFERCAQFAQEMKVPVSSVIISFEPY